MREKTSKHTSLWITAEEAAPLRRVALALDIIQPRAAEETGSVSGLIRALAQHATEDEAGTIATLRQLIGTR